MANIFLKGRGSFIVIGNRIFSCGGNGAGQLSNDDNGVLEDIFAFEPVKLSDGLIAGANGQKVNQIILGNSHSLVQTDDELWACGDNSNGQLGLRNDDGQGDEELIFFYSRLRRVPLDRLAGQSIRQAIAGNSYTLLLTDNNQLWFCGDSNRNALGIAHLHIEDDPDQRMGSHEKYHPELIRIPEGGIPHELVAQSIRQIASGDTATFLVTENDQLWVAGDNEYGQLGLGHRNNSAQFVKVFIPAPIQQVIAGNHHTFVVTKTQELWGCGRNNHGQLGLGDILDRYIFTRITIRPPGQIRQISVGGAHTFFLTEGGELFACGLNFDGQLGLGDRLPRHHFTPVPFARSEYIEEVAAGDSHNIVRTRRNKVFSCGSNASGQLGLPRVKSVRCFTYVATIAHPLAPLSEPLPSLMNDVSFPLVGIRVAAAVPAAAHATAATHTEVVGISLPIELWEKILLCLTPKELGLLGQVCKEFYNSVRHLVNVPHLPLYQNPRKPLTAKISYGHALEWAKQLYQQLQDEVEKENFRVQFIGCITGALERNPVLYQLCRVSEMGGSGYLRLDAAAVPAAAAAPAPAPPDDAGRVKRARPN